MRSLSKQELLALAEERGGLRVSIFLPTHGPGAGEQQDAICLRNLLRDAEHRLAVAGVRRREARDLLAPGIALAGDTAFWRVAAGGVALFLAPDGRRRLRLPYRPRELVVVGPRFHVKPLLPLCCGDGRFHVLALSQRRTRLFEGDREGLREVELPGVPAGLATIPGSNSSSTRPARRGPAAGRRRCSTATACAPTTPRTGSCGTSAPSTTVCTARSPTGERRWCWPPSTTCARSIGPPAPTPTSWRRASPATPTTSSRTPCTGRPGGWSAPASDPTSRRPAPGSVSSRAVTAPPATCGASCRPPSPAGSSRCWSPWAPSGREPRRGDIDLLDLAAVETLRHGGTACVLFYLNLHQDAADRTRDRHRPPTPDQRTWAVTGFAGG